MYLRRLCITHLWVFFQQRRGRVGHLFRSEASIATTGLVALTIYVRTKRPCGQHEEEQESIETAKFLSHVVSLCVVIWTDLTWESNRRRRDATSDFHRINRQRKIQACFRPAARFVQGRTHSDAQASAG